MKSFAGLVYVPHYLHSDQGANLIRNLMAAVCEHLGIEWICNSTYHPQGHGQVEQFNHSLESLLVIRCGLGHE